MPSSDEEGPSLISLLPQSAASWLPSRPCWAEQIGSIITYNNCSGQVTLSWHGQLPCESVHMQAALMERIRCLFPAGAQAWLTPAKTPRLACQQICDALGRNKHRHFCSSGPKLRRNISVLYCFPDRRKCFFQFQEGRFLNAHYKGSHPIHSTQEPSAFILFSSLFNKKELSSSPCR